MGWLFTQGASRRDVIDKLVRTEDNESYRFETLAHAVRGNVLWSVVERTRKADGAHERFIACYVLHKNKDPDCGGWGYKGMTESMGPFYYTCPVSYLEMVPEVGNAEWREQVRERAKHKRRRFNVGDRIELNGATIPWVVIRSTHPLRGEYRGRVYRVPRRYLGQVLDTHTGGTP